MTTRDLHLEFIDNIKNITGLSVSAIAKKAKISDSTLTRFIKKPEYDSLSSATLNKVSGVGGFDSYEDYLLKNSISDAKPKKIEISDAQKFEMYESVKRLLAVKYGAAKPSLIASISEQVLVNAFKLNTSFITDSLIMYVIEKDCLESGWGRSGRLFLSLALLTLKSLKPADGELGAIPFLSSSLSLFCFSAWFSNFSHSAMPSFESPLYVFKPRNINCGSMLSLKSPFIRLGFISSIL
jgi:hypothetical protein